MATTTTQLLTVAEAAERLAVLPARLQRWAKASRVPSVILPDGEVRFSPADLDVLIAEHRRSSPHRQGASDE